MKQRENEMIKYKVKGYGELYIERIKIERETKHFVFYKDGGSDRVWQESNIGFFDTFEDAKDHIIKDAQSDIDNYERELARAKQRLAKAEALTE